MLMSFLLGGMLSANGNSLSTSETRVGATGTKSTGRTYDRQNRLLSRTDENGQTLGYRYYPSGKLWKIIYPGGSESGTGHVEYTWWKTGQLKHVLDKLDSITFFKRTEITEKSFCFDAGAHRAYRLKQHISANDSRQPEETVAS
jgi:YD repeat-containing protein